MSRADVYENMPHVPEKLFVLQNVVHVPHVGSRTIDVQGHG